MVDDKYLRQWVSDQLMTLMGYSEHVVVKYVIRISKESAAPSDIVGKLVDYGFPSSTETQMFAKQIFGKVPHKRGGSSLYEKEEKEAALLAKRQRSYRLIDADDDDALNVESIPVKPDRRKNFRKKSELEDVQDETEEESQTHVPKSTKKDDEYDSEDDFELEQDRLRDQEEREQLERSIRQRDAAGTRKLMEPKLSKKDEEEMQKRLKALEQNDISNLRKISRQEYVKKRRDQKLVEMK